MRQPTTPPRPPRDADRLARPTSYVQHLRALVEAGDVRTRCDLADEAYLELLAKHGLDQSGRPMPARRAAS